MKAYEVMTHSLATVSPETSVSSVAAIMRDRDIGDVLIMEDGKLRGIVTDRDLAIQALTGSIDPQETPITKFMNSKVVKGEADWPIDKVADVMSKNQIRRLPIMRNDQLVGIISLGDLATHEHRKDVVSKSLHAISKPIPVTGGGSGMVSGLLTLLLAAGVATAALWLTFHRNGKEFRKQIGKSDIYQNAQDVVVNARDKVGEAANSKQVRKLARQMQSSVGEAANSKQVRKLARQMQSSINDLTSQVSMLDGKAIRRKHTLFG